MSALYYSDGQQMHLGDHIRVSRFLRRPLMVVVEYLTNESPPNPHLEIPFLLTFAVIPEKGTVMAWNREPDSRLETKFQLIKRGQPVSPINPGEPLD